MAMLSMNDCVASVASVPDETLPPITTRTLSLRKRLEN